MRKDKYPNDSIVQLMVGAEVKIQWLLTEMAQNREEELMMEKHLSRVQNALFLLHEARMVLSVSTHPLRAEEDVIPF